MVFYFQQLQSTSTRKRQSLKFFDTESCDNIYLWNLKPIYKENMLNNRLSCKSFDDLAPVSNAVVNGSLERRLSPKVFTNATEVLPVSQSLENLKTQSELCEDLEVPNSFLKKRSLQDLTAYLENTVPQVSYYSRFVLWVFLHNRTIEGFGQYLFIFIFFNVLCLPLFVFPL